MKKLIFPILFLFAVSLLYAMPPMPGSGLTHDGSIFEDDELYSYSARTLSLNRSSGSSSAKSSALAGTTGSKTILVILAGFSDYGFNSGSASSAQTHNVAYYTNLLQGASGLTMKKYYHDQSRGLLDLSFKVVGGPSYTSANGYAYYGANEDGRRGNDILPGHLVYEMLKIASTDPELAGVDLDNCTVIIVHAGPGEEVGGVSPDWIWSHRSSLSERKSKEAGTLPVIDPVTVQGKVFDDYLIVPEYNAWHGIYEATIGVFCHEFGHVLGLPDAYDTTGATSGVGQWSLMGGGSWGSVGRAGVPPGSDPAPFMGWELILLGWIDEAQIATAPGTSSHSFTDINSADKVYTVKLADDQFLVLEGRAKNMSGSGLCSLEKGLLITQLHMGILRDYWPRNKINDTSYRPHAAMVVEAKAANYKTNGLGNLWQADSTNNRFTTTALFRSDTLTSISPSGTAAAASGFLLGALAAWYRGRKKLCAILAVIALAAVISTGCSISSSGGGTYDSGPNTNYYTSTSNVHSKTGDSGITIYDIKVNEDGSGSFTVKKE